MRISVSGASGFSRGENESSHAITPSTESENQPCDLSRTISFPTQRSFIRLKTRYFKLGPALMRSMVLFFNCSLYSADGNVESQRVVSKYVSNQEVSQGHYAEKNEKSNSS